MPSKKTWRKRWLWKVLLMFAASETELGIKFKLISDNQRKYFLLVMACTLPSGFMDNGLNE